MHSVIDHNMDLVICGSYNEMAIQNASIEAVHVTSTTLTKVAATTVATKPGLCSQDKNIELNYPSSSVMSKINMHTVYLLQIWHP